MISLTNGVFKVNIARKCVSRLWVGWGGGGRGGSPGGLEFYGTKILAQFTNYIFLYLTMMYPQYTEEITRKSIHPFL